MPKDQKELKGFRFKSPLSKLVNFFEQSRDNWKAKYMKAKYRAKLLSDQVRYWKKQNVELKRQLKELKKELSESEKKIQNKNDKIIAKFRNVPDFHTYSYGHIFLYVQLVLFSSISMRAASRGLHLILSFFEIDIFIPSWTAGRLWLLRIGLYKLERPKEIANDWIWIIDHTVQLGNVKCMVILGIRQAHFPKGELHLTHEDVEPIALTPVKKSNGNIVFQQLEENIKKTGIPAQIISDHGPDIKCGVKMFCQKYDTIPTYDMKHKGAAIIKRELTDNTAWQKFASKASKTGKKVQQTKLSFMAPPNQRSKARYMNIKELVDWGTDLICHWDLKKTENFESSEIYRKFGWVYDFRDDLKDWKSLVEIIETANDFGNFMGLYKGMDVDLEQELSLLPKNDNFEHIKEEMVVFTRQEQEKLRHDDRLLASSEIIESVIGKYKGLQGDQVKGGFTGMLLGLAASVSDFSMDTIKKAIDSTPTKKVWDWIKENVEQSVYSQRKEFRKIAKEQEQNREENFCTVFN